MIIRTNVVDFSRCAFSGHPVSCLSVAGYRGPTITKAGNPWGLVGQWLLLLELQVKPSTPTDNHSPRLSVPIVQCSPKQDEMPVLMKAANMICAVLRNGERLAAAAREAAGGGRGDRGPPGSNGGGGGGGGDRNRGGPAPYNPAGPPQASQPQPTAAPVNYQYQQAPPVSGVCIFGWRVWGLLWWWDRAGGVGF